MSHAIQKMGMNHLLDLKHDAIELWKDRDCCPSAWYECVEAVLLKHRLDMKEQYDKGDFQEKDKDRRTQDQRLEDDVAEHEQEEILQIIRDAEVVFNADLDE